MVIDGQKLTVHTVNFLHGEGPVFYASLPSGPLAGQKHYLICGLWDHLLAVKNPHWMWPHVNPDAFPIQVIRGHLGRPQLLLGEHQGPPISFCESNENVWAALCGDQYDIGIDVAESHEFQGKYPFYRVFHPQELRHALKLVGEDLKKAAALLWSVKEAVAKALGCAFHLVDPQQIVVYSSTDGATGGAVGGTTEIAAKENRAYDFSVELSGKASKQFPMASGRSLRVRSISHGKKWLSIALLNRQSQ